jgi:hypothetical protein
MNNEGLQGGRPPSKTDIDAHCVEWWTNSPKSGGRLSDQYQLESISVSVNDFFTKLR